MTEKDLKQLLEQIQNNEISVKNAVEKLKQGPLGQTETSFFIPDDHRVLRLGLGEVVYAESKKNKHLRKIALTFAKKDSPTLFTRLKKKQLQILINQHPKARVNKSGRTLILNPPQIPKFEKDKPFVAIVAAGTSDVPVVEEAYETCVAMAIPVYKTIDVGVAGLHRVVEKLHVLQKATAIVVVAGMEGALPSVVGGLVDCPVFAVPTSVGYGTSFNGVSALLGMLNSCAPGIMVSNIDNGFSAAFAACQVVRMAKK